MTPSALGRLLHAFFEDYLKVQKGLRPTSVRSYRDVLKLFLCFVAASCGRKLSRLAVDDLTAERVLQFLRHLETERNNQVATRNHRLTVLRGFFEYLARRIPEALMEAQRVAGIPTRRCPPPATGFLESDEIHSLFARLPRQGRFALRDRARLFFLYNTGARAQEVADLRVANLELSSPPRVRLHGKGDKWRLCPLWPDTAQLLTQLLDQQRVPPSPESPVFASCRHTPPDALRHLQDRASTCGLAASPASLARECSASRLSASVST